MQLNRTTAPADLLIPARAPQEAGIVHLGLGNFYRAHAAVYTAKAIAAEGGEWGISAYANRSRSVVDAMQAQDGLYSVLYLSPDGNRVAIPDVFRGLGVLAEDPAGVVNDIANPARKIVTLTVTEGGYGVKGGHRTLNLDDPAIKRDLEGHGPSTIVGILARGIEKRAASGEAITIQSCDNIPANGELTRAVVQQFLQESGASADVLSFLESRVSFPNSMVDQIVPGTTDATRASVEQILGLKDAAPVPTENFTMWAIEDNFAAGRPAWEAAGATITNEVEKYENLKLRTVNGGQSLLSYLGVLSNQPTVPGTWALEQVKHTMDYFLRQEVLPTLDLPQGVDGHEYIDALQNRWLNTPLGDSTARIASFGSDRIPLRIPDAVNYHLAQGNVPNGYALLVASWIAANLHQGTAKTNEPLNAITEPLGDTLRTIERESANSNQIAKRVIDEGLAGGALRGRDAFSERVGDLLAIINDGGISAAMDHIRK